MLSELGLRRLKDELTREEGYRTLMYKDTEGIETIGIGFNLRRPDAQRLLEEMGYDYKEVLVGKVGLTYDHIDTLFEISVAQAIEELGKIFPDLSDVEEEKRIVLVDLMFQLGPKRFKGFVKMIAAINERDWKQARLELLDSRLAKQTPARTRSRAEVLGRTDDEHASQTDCWTEKH